MNVSPRVGCRGYHGYVCRIIQSHIAASSVVSHTKEGDQKVVLIGSNRPTHTQIEVTLAD